MLVFINFLLLFLGCIFFFLNVYKNLFLYLLDIKFCFAHFTYFSSILMVRIIFGKREAFVNTVRTSLASTKLAVFRTLVILFFAHKAVAFHFYGLFLRYPPLSYLLELENGIIDVELKFSAIYCNKLLLFVK